MCYLSLSVIICHRKKCRKKDNWGAQYNRIFWEKFRAHNKGIDKYKDKDR